MNLRLPLLIMLATLAGQAADRIYFSRIFPGAVPGAFEVILEDDGKVSYIEPDEEPIKFALASEEVDELFQQAKSLDYFSQELASTRKVASSGKKVLRYESDSEVKGEAKFDYSEDETARELASWFVKVSETQGYLLELERVLRFDPLGVNQVLVNLQNAFKRERIVGQEQFIPVLTKISERKRIVHIARARADGLLEKIRGQTQ